MSSIPSKRPAPANIDDIKAEALRRAAEARARIEALRKGASTPATASPTPPPPPSHNGAAPTPPPGAAATKTGLGGLADIKARMAAALAKSKSAQADALPPERPAARPGYGAEPIRFEDREPVRPSRGGLDVAVHPLLRDDAPDVTKKYDRRNKGRKAEEEKKSFNPYLSEGPPGPGVRKKRELKFTHDFNHRPALEAAAEARRKAALEEMKARIQASAAKAGLDEAVDTSCFQVPEPPDMEWWDEPLQTPEDFIENITNLVVHPVLIDPAQEKFTAGKGPVMYLTKKEQKKMRRMRRAEQHKEEQTKIRLGLAPAPAPKINHKNVMRVYGELAVQGPSAVEEMVNKQMAERQAKHEAANTERQLTKEQKAEKYEQKAAENAAMGLYLHVYKVSLGSEKLNNKHRYLINKNASEWKDMHGVALVTPSFTLVIVEGGIKSTSHFKKLMLRRIKWQAILEGGGEIVNKEEWEGVEDNTCVLVHEGQIRERKFKKWGNLRDVDTDQKARDALAKAKLENYWVMAKSLEKGGTS